MVGVALRGSAVVTVTAALRSVWNTAASRFVRSRRRFRRPMRAERHLRARRYRCCWGRAWVPSACARNKPRTGVARSHDGRFQRSGLAWPIPRWTGPSAIADAGTARPREPAKPTTAAAATERLRLTPRPPRPPRRDRATVAAPHAPPAAPVAPTARAATPATPATCAPHPRPRTTPPARHPSSTARPRHTRRTRRRATWSR